MFHNSLVLTMDFVITNVKISVKIQAKPLDIVQKVLEAKNILCKTHNNFLVAKSEYTFIIFKSKFGDGANNHINITKIPNLSFIPHVILLTETLLECRTFQHRIDNISATSNSPQRLNLVKLVEKKKFKNIKYNNQTFPGLFLSFNTGTAILFHSGKINIVGCKSEANLKCILSKIFANI